MSTFLDIKSQRLSNLFWIELTMLLFLAEANLVILSATLSLVVNKQHHFFKTVSPSNDGPLEKSIPLSPRALERAPPSRN